MIGLNTIWKYHDTWLFGMQNTSNYLKKLSRFGDMFDLTYNLLGTKKHGNTLPGTPQNETLKTKPKNRS